METILCSVKRGLKGQYHPLQASMLDPCSIQTSPHLGRPSKELGSLILVISEVLAVRPEYLKYIYIVITQKLCLFRFSYITF